MSFRIQPSSGTPAPLSPLAIVIVVVVVVIVIAVVVAVVICFKRICAFCGKGQFNFIAYYSKRSRMFLCQVESR